MNRLKRAARKYHLRKMFDEPTAEKLSENRNFRVLNKMGEIVTDYSALSVAWHRAWKEKNKARSRNLNYLADARESGFDGYVENCLFFLGRDSIWSLSDGEAALLCQKVERAMKATS